jgi:hypothetical protein
VVAVNFPVKLESEANLLPLENPLLKDPLLLEEGLELLEEEKEEEPKILAIRVAI